MINVCNSENSEFDTGMELASPADATSNRFIVPDGVPPTQPYPRDPHTNAPNHEQYISNTLSQMSRDPTHLPPRFLQNRRSRLLIERNDLSRWAGSGLRSHPSFYYRSDLRRHGAGLGVCLLCPNQKFIISSIPRSFPFYIHFLASMGCRISFSPAWREEALPVANLELCTRKAAWTVANRRRITPHPCQVK